MNTENSMIQRIEALPEARKNTILETMWLLGKLQLIDNYTIETLVRASEQVEAEGAKAVSREDFYEQEQRDDEADNTPMSDRDTVLVEGIGTMLRIQAASCACRRGDPNLTLAYEKAANGPAYKEGK